MKLKQLIFSVCLTLPIAIPATAGGGVGTVDQLLVGRNGHEVYVSISGTITDFPCSTSHPSGFNFAFSLTNHQAANGMLATLNAA